METIHPCLFKRKGKEWVAKSTLGAGELSIQCSAVPQEQVQQKNNFKSKKQLLEIIFLVKVSKAILFYFWVLFIEWMRTSLRWRDSFLVRDRFLALMKFYCTREDNCHKVLWLESLTVLRGTDPAYISCTLSRIWNFIYFLVCVSFGFVWLDRSNCGID